MKIDFYGQLADRLGARSLTLDGETPSDGQKLRQLLNDMKPEISEILNRPGTRLMVNDEITDWDSTLAAAHSIAIIPVVSGG